MKYGFKLLFLSFWESYPAHPLSLIRSWALSSPTAVGLKRGKSMETFTDINLVSCTRTSVLHRPFQIMLQRVELVQEPK